MMNSISRFFFSRSSWHHFLAAFHLSEFIFNCFFINNSRDEYKIGTVKYSYEYIKSEALKYSSRSEFKKNSPGAYNAAVGRKILDSIAGHLPPNNTKYTADVIFKEAVKYNTKAEFALYSRGAYNAAHRRGIANEACKHMIVPAASIPQKICKQIFDILLNEDGILDDTTTIKPYHIDVFYPSHKFGIEYDGVYWHRDNADISNRRSKKLLKIEESGIKVFFLKETLDNKNDYEKYVKDLIISNLSNIEELINYQLSAQTVKDCIINYQKLYDSVVMTDVYNYNSITELSHKNRCLFNLCRKDVIEYENIKKFYKTKQQEKKLYNNSKRRQQIKEDIINIVKQKYRTYGELLDDRELLKRCRNLNIINEVKTLLDTSVPTKSRRIRRDNIIEYKKFISDMTDDVFVSYILENFEEYNLARADYIILCNIRNRNMVEYIRNKFNNGFSRKGRWTKYSDEELLDIYNKSTSDDMKTLNNGLYDACYRRGLMK